MPHGCSKPRILIVDCGRIVAYREMGASYWITVKTIGCLVKAVHIVIKKNQKTSTPIDKHISSRIRITTQRELSQEFYWQSQAKWHLEYKPVWEGINIVLFMSTVQCHLRGVGLRA